MSRFIFSLFITFLVAGLPLKVFAVGIDFGSAAKVKPVDKENFENYTAGQSLEVKEGDAFFVVPEAGIPLLIVSPTNSSAKISLSGNAGNISRTLVQPLVDKTLNELIDEIQRVHSLIEKRDYNNASSRVRALREKYPQLSSVHFLSGTINYLINNKRLALEDVERGLAIDPSNEAGKRMRERLQRAQ